jgi:hypothetical protein
MSSIPGVILHANLGETKTPNDSPSALQDHASIFGRFLVSKEIAKVVLMLPFVVEVKILIKNVYHDNGLRLILHPEKFLHGRDRYG